MSSVAQSKVSGIIKSLSVLEDDLDSLHSKASDMRKRFAIKAQSEFDGLLEQVRKMAATEAESIIAKARQNAESQAEKIAKNGEERLASIKSRIDSNFDAAVQDVIEAALKK